MCVFLSVQTEKSPKVTVRIKSGFKKAQGAVSVFELSCNHFNSGSMVRFVLNQPRTEDTNIRNSYLR